ncbi:MAG TPA: molybdenum cofactor cytidylyltransferase [Ktedonobacterales bacterium]|jgi:molybdenum cofactor cytidylyltransferase
MIAAVLLAAGQSSRMGQHKLLLPLLGKPLVLHTVQSALASEVDETLVVVGYRAEAVREALAGQPVRIVENPDYAQGQSTSLRAGVAALAPETEAVVILLGDQPLLTAGLLNALMAAWKRTASPIVAPVYGGQRGNPVLFSRALFQELLAVSGDQGGREVIQRHAGESILVQMEDPAAALDVDTWQEYQALLARLEAGLER